MTTTRMPRSSQQAMWGIINTVVTSTTNAIDESLNAQIQKIKV